MFKHILLPLDFTEKNDPAIDVATGLAAASASRVTLLHVIEALEGTPSEDVDGFYETLEARARKKLARLRTDFEHLHPGAGPGTTEIAITLGNRAREIVRFAADSEVDLIVMSSRPMGSEGGSPKHWPTISHKVAMVAPCPILLVR